MPPPRTGSVEPLKRADGSRYFRARIRLADDSRERVDVPEAYSKPAGRLTARERAELYALALQEREDEGGEQGPLLVAKRAREAEAAKRSDPRRGETCTKYFDRLNIHRKELGRRGWNDDAGTWRVWLEERLGSLLVTEVTRDDIEAVRDALDEAITLHKRTEGKKGIGAKRASNVWTVLTTTFKASCMAKRRDLRVRETNPCTGVLPPERGESRRRTFIYPTEAGALFACEGVPLEWRELYAVACYSYLRPGELRVLTRADVDLQAQVIHVSKAYDERSGEEKPPKTRNGVRDVPIHPNLAPLLRRLCEGKSAGDVLVPLLSSLSKEQYALKVRQHLALAKVDRARLTENTATTMHVGFRSWRDTGITWLALAGVDVVKMQRRAGHDNVTTTMGYVKAAEDIAGTIGTPFPKLPKALVKPSKKTGAKGGGGGKRDRAKSPRLGQVGRLHRVLPAKTVAPPGVEPGHPFGSRILNPLRLPFRQGAVV
jgi:integrase